MKGTNISAYTNEWVVLAHAAPSAPISGTSHTRTKTDAKMAPTPDTITGQVRPVATGKMLYAAAPATKAPGIMISNGDEASAKPSPSTSRIMDS